MVLVGGVCNSRYTAVFSGGQCGLFLCMKTNQTQIDLGKNMTATLPWTQYEKIIVDRGSKYSVTGGYVMCRDDIKAFLKQIKSSKKYQKATHNTWAARVTKDGQVWDIKNDDGEAGAGATILRQLQKDEMVNVVVVVTRWFGGTMLHGDRFKHVQDATRYWLERVEKKEA